MDNPELIEKFEHDLWMLIFKAHKDGIGFSNLHFILTETIKTLGVQSHVEDWLKDALGGSKEGIGSP